MFVRLGLFLFILALLAAASGHWTVLQAVAWTKMVANNLGTDSVAAAFTKIIDGTNPCKLCKQISAGTQTEKKAEFPTLVKKWFSHRQCI